MAFFLFTDKIFKGIPIDVFNHGDLLRDFTYVEDLVEAIRRLMDTPPEMGAPVSQNDSLSPVAPYRLVNIGNETPVRLMDYIEAIEDAIGRKAVKNMIGMQPGDVKQTYADASLLTVHYSRQVGFVSEFFLGILLISLIMYSTASSIKVKSLDIFP